MIQIKQVSKKYGEAQVLDNLRMMVETGEIYGLLGENGAGKTTMMKMILNLVKPDSGEIAVMGEPVGRESYRYLSEIGSMIEYPVFYQHLTAAENLELHCSYMNSGTGNMEEVLQLTGLESAGAKPVREFSLGMKQRLGLARAIVTRPKLLILDEPVNGLDPVGIRDIRLLLLQLKQEWGATILISSHIVSEIESLADRIGVLHQGRIMAEAQMNEIKNLEDYFFNVIRGGNER